MLFFQYIRLLLEKCLLFMVGSGFFFQGRNRIQFFLLVWSGPGFSSPSQSATLSITAFPRILSTVSMIITIQLKLGMLHVRYIYCMLAISGVLNFFFHFQFHWDCDWNFIPKWNKNSFNTYKFHYFQALTTKWGFLVFNVLQS